MTTLQPVDSALIDRAVKAGLVLMPCGACKGTGECECPMCVDDDPHREPCPGCDGCGEDRASWGPVGAVLMSGYAVVIDVRAVSVAAHTDPDHRWHQHDGTPESIATAALTAFCRAKENAR